MWGTGMLKRDAQFPEYAKDYFHQIREQYDLLIDESGAQRPASVSALIAKTQDRTYQIAWADVFLIETAYLYAVPDGRLGQELSRLRARYHDVVGESAYAEYARSVATDVTKLTKEEQRAELMTIAERIQYEYTFVPPKEALRNRISMQTSALTLGIILFGTAVYLWLVNAKMPVPTLIAVIFAGVLGGFLSCQQRLQSAQNIDPLLKELQLASGWFSVVVLAPLSGGVFGVVIYMLFVAGLLSGGLFPSFGTTSQPAATTAPVASPRPAAAAPKKGGVAPSVPQPAPGSSGGSGMSFDRFIGESDPVDAASYGKLLVWAFIAGFAERFVPDVLTRIAGQPFNLGGGSRPGAPAPAGAPLTDGSRRGTKDDEESGSGDGQTGGEARTKPAASASPSPTIAHLAPGLPSAPHAGAVTQLAHIVVDRASKRCKLFLRHADGTVELKHDIEAHTDAVGSENGDPYGPDGLAPPGDYGLGGPQPCATRNSDGSVTVNNVVPPDWDRAFGCWFTPLTDTHGLEGAHGRSGIGFHGGGSNAPDSFAWHQGWYATCGCIRLQNEDNEKTFVPFVKAMQKAAVPIVVSISQETTSGAGARATAPPPPPASAPARVVAGAPHFAVNGRDAQNYVWGVDSAASLLAVAPGTQQDIVSFLTSRTGHAPAFWGRYLTNFAIGQQEVALMRSLRIPIVPIYNGTGLQPAATVQDGREHAAQAIAKARVLGIPAAAEPHPVCIYADVEQHIAYVTADWYRGWCDAILGAGYHPGVYGKANDPDFATPYETAFRRDDNVKAMYYWASHDNFEVSERRESLAEATPPFAADGFPTLPPFLDDDAHRHRFVMWQYMEDAHNRTYDYDLALQSALDAMWRPWT